MAPAKKTLDKVQKPPIKRIRRTKPPPNSTTITIPVQKEIVPDVPPATPILTRKQLISQIKLDMDNKKINLANEVARSQLVKSEPIIFDEPKEQIVVPKRGRRKKIVSQFFLDSEVAKEPKIQTPKRVFNKKVTPTKAEVKEKAVPKKRQADSTVKRTLKRPKLTPQSHIIRKDETVTNKIAPRVTRSRKGKQEDLATAEISPSILAGFDTASPIIETNAITPKKEIDSKSPTKEVLNFPVEGAGLIGSRKASLNSIASSGRSWIRDISSTSTTTCVTVSSNEFVRFNYKLPVIQLTNIDNEVGKYKNNDVDESSSSDSESDSSDSEHKYPGQLDRSVGVNSPKLSVSSSSSSEAPNTEAGKSERVAFLLDKLKSVLKQFDMEIINGLRFDNEDISVDVNRLKDKLFDVLDIEFGVISQCKNVRRLLNPQSEKENDDIEENISRVEANHDIDFLANNDSNEFKDDMPFDMNVKNIIDAVKDDSEGEPTHKDLDNFASEKCNYVRFDHGDDDDALSLFAESITGIDSSRLNSSTASMSDVRSEEYIPQPVKSTFVSPDKYVYCPTKIADATNSIKPKTICEKQNADSTSIYREIHSKHEHENIVLDDKPAINDSLNTATVSAYKNETPCLILSQFRPINIVQSIVFKGVCFFNMINSCKKSGHGQSGRYPHVFLDVAEIKDRLATINEEWFIQEYVTMRNWPELRRLYGMCFVNECVRRELTRILVEMALDFVKKANIMSREDSELKIQVAETTLLHLNKVGFSECEDLLKYYVKSGTQLCDFFMKTLALTQNFTRFKEVFINLTSYIVKNDRMFSFTVASAILERVCILPYDRSLAETLLNIIKHTSRKIFDSSMIGHFEKQISSSKELFEDYLSVKRSRQSVVTPVMASPIASPLQPPLGLPGEPAASQPDEEDTAALAPSPDTTDYDNMNKNSDEPKVTRILNFNRVHSHNSNVPPTFVSPSSSQLQRVIRKSLPITNNWKTNVHPYTRQHFNAHRPHFSPHRPQFGPRGPQFGFQRPHFSPQRPPRSMGTLIKSPKRVVTYGENPTTVCRYTPQGPRPNY